jgi:hypothetical protein
VPQVLINTTGLGITRNLRSCFVVVDFKLDKIHYRVRNNSGQAVSDLVPISKETLTPAQFAQLADVPPELEWLANITNPKTRRAHI